MEAAAPVVERGNNAIVLVPPVREAVVPLLSAIRKPPTLVLTLDADRAADLADAMPGAFAATSYARTQQRLAAAVPPVLCVGVSDALSLLRKSALQPATFASVVLAWPDQLDEAGQQALEAVMAECDREAQRLVLVSTAGPAAASLSERYAFKAMTYGFAADGHAPAGPTAGPARFVVARHESFGGIRRRILDALNPAGDDDVIIAPVPLSREAAVELAARATPGTPPVIVAEAHQVAWLRTVFSPLTSLALPHLSVRLEERAEVLRASLARTIENENLDRELFQIGPLLAQFDPALVAAAALRLSQPVPGARPAAPTEAERAPRPAAGPSHAKLWVGVGKKDNIRPGDLVGALANEAKVPADAIGKIEVRELFCLVEVKSEHAEQAVSGLSGVTVRGRRLAVRMDRGAGAKPPRRA